MDTRSIILALYRKQLRLCRAFDHAPGLLALLPYSGLTAPPGAPPVALSVLHRAQVIKQTFFNQCGQEWYMPLPGFTAEAYCRQLYRARTRALAVPGGALGQAAAQGADEDTLMALTPVGYEQDGRPSRRLEPIEPATAVDAGLNIHREMLQLQEVCAQEARDVSASSFDLPLTLGKQVGRLAEAAGISPGCLLLEHPGATRPGRTVILVYDISQNVQEVHGNEAWMLRGLVVNRPYPQTVAKVTGASEEQVAAMGPLGQLTLFHGGSDTAGLFVVHALGEEAVPGAVAVDPVGEGAGAGSGLFLGGDASAINAFLSSGKASAGEIKVCQGSIEIPLEGDPGSAGGLSLPDPGRWLIASGPGVRDVALCAPLFDTQGPWRDGKGLGIGEQVEGYNYGRFWHQNGVWRHAWRAVGLSMAQEGGPGEREEQGRAVAAMADVHTSIGHYLHALGPLQLQLVATAQLAYAQAAAREEEEEQVADKEGREDSKDKASH